MHSLIAQPSSPLGRAIHPHCGPEGWMGEALARTKGGGLTKLVTGSAEAGCVLGFRISGTSRTSLALIFFFLTSKENELFLKTKHSDGLILE